MSETKTRTGRLSGKIVVDASRCKGCGLCIAECPKGHLHLSEQADSRGIRTVRFDGEDRCTGCGFCYTVCPDVAITVYRKKGKGK
jgi:2-oxoglutarate ferredoxin oxidoreductase subunit delta